MNPQTEQDIHLIAAPFRFVKAWLQILLFIIVAPIVFIVCLIKWMLTGEPIMSPDEIILAKWAIILLSPVWIPLLGIIIWVVSKRLKEREAEKLRAKEVAEELHAEGLDDINIHDLAAVATERELDLEDLIDARYVLWCKRSVETLASPKADLSKMCLGKCAFCQKQVPAICVDNQNDWTTLTAYHDASCRWIEMQGEALNMYRSTPLYRWPMYRSS